MEMTKSIITLSSMIPVFFHISLAERYEISEEREP